MSKVSLSIGMLQAKYGVIIASETFGDAVCFACCDFFGQINEFLMSYNRVCAAEDFAEHFKIGMDTGHSTRSCVSAIPSRAMSSGLSAEILSYCT